MESNAASAPVARRDGWRFCALLGAIALLAAAAGYAWTLGDYFVGDDFAYIGRYFDFSWREWPSLFVRGWADHMWSRPLRELRPVNALLFMADSHAWGLSPTAFRITNLLLHAACATLVGLIAWRVMARCAWAAIAAAVFFALHPVSAGAVAWITGRVDLLATFFLLGGFLAYVRYRDEGGSRALWTLALAQGGAAFTKESGVLLPLLLLAADLIWRRGEPSLRERRTWAPYLACGVMLLGYFICRRIAFGIGGPSGVGRSLPDVFAASTYLEFARREIGYLTHLLPPLQPSLVAWREAGFIPNLSLLLRAAACCVAVAAGGLLLLRGRTQANAAERRALVFFGVGWFLLTTIPLFVTYYSARHIYPAAAGFALALALGLRRAVPAPRLRFVAGAAIALFFAGQLWSALRPWHESARISRAVAHEISLLARDAAADDVLLLDVPPLHDGAFCWSWALPYALRPPFSPEAMETRVTALGPPEGYAFGLSWHRQPALARLATAERDCWLITVSRRGETRRLRVPAADVRAASVHLRAARNLDTSVAAWAQFVAALGIK